MRHIHPRRLLAAVAAALSVTLSVPTIAMADCSTTVHPRMSAYVGVAFIGTVADIVEVSPQGEVSWDPSHLLVTYEVDEVLAGHPGPRFTVEQFGAGSCANIQGSQLVVGDRVLLTGVPGYVGFVMDGEGFDDHEIIWRADGHGAWRFDPDLYYHPERYPAAARRATTTADIVRLVSPEELPPTDGMEPLDADPPAAALTAVLLSLTGAVGGAWFAMSMRRRRVAREISRNSQT